MGWRDDLMKELDGRLADVLGEEGMAELTGDRLCAKCGKKVRFVVKFVDKGGNRAGVMKELRKKFLCSRCRSEADRKKGGQ